MITENKSNNAAECEWNFTVPPDKVDLKRIVTELSYLSESTKFMYMGDLKYKAPIVYERLRKYCEKYGELKWWRFQQ